MHASLICCRCIAGCRPCNHPHPTPNTPPRPRTQSAEATLVHFPKTPQSVMVGKSTARIGRDFACQRVKTCHSLDFGKPGPQIKSSLHDYRNSGRGPRGCDLAGGGLVGALATGVGSAGRADAHWMGVWMGAKPRSQYWMGHWKGRPVPT